MMDLSCELRMPPVVLTTSIVGRLRYTGVSFKLRDGRLVHGICIDSFVDNDGRLLCVCKKIIVVGEKHNELLNQAVESEMIIFAANVVQDVNLVDQDGNNVTLLAIVDNSTVEIKEGAESVIAVDGFDEIDDSDEIGECKGSEACEFYGTVTAIDPFVCQKNNTYSFHEKV